MTRRRRWRYAAVFMAATALFTSTGCSYDMMNLVFSLAGTVVQAIVTAAASSATTGTTGTTSG